MPLSIITWIRSRAISSEEISVPSSEIQIEAFAFISAVQSVKVKAWSANNVPICTSITRPWKMLSPNCCNIWDWVACTTSRKSICGAMLPLNTTFTDSGIGIVASPVASASATVPESAPKATPLDIRVCESPPIIIDQSSTVISFSTLWITSVIAWYSSFGSRAVISPNLCINCIRRGVFSCALKSHTDAVWQPDW